MITLPSTESLTTKQAAEFLKVNAHLIRRLVREGKLKAFALGKSWTFTEQNLIECREQFEIVCKNNVHEFVRKAMAK